MDLQTGTVVDRYTVQSVLGEGGMAVVYLCRHNQLGTMHALKVLTMSSRAIRERLVQEGRVQAQLRHRNIVAVTDIIVLNGAPGLVMEYIEGPSLDELLEQKPLSYEQADALAEGVLEGVAHAHSQGLVHRDLKPANIMLALEGSMLVPKVTDFGLAKLLEGDTGRAATRTGSTMGTPHYMSPEQVSDSKNVDHRTDVFALGAILYELVCGRRAFGGENLLQIFSAVAQAKYTPPRELRPDLPDRMEAAILGALEPDKDKRIQTTEELRRVWTGMSPHAGATEPEAPAGPFSAEFLSSVSRSSGTSESSVPSAGTWAGDSQISVTEEPISVETLHKGPPLDAQSAPKPPPPETTNEVPATSMVSGKSLVMGGSAAFMFAAIIGGVGLAAVGLIGFGAWYAGRDPVMTAVPVASPMPAPGPGDPEPVVDPEPVPDPGPRPSPGPAPVRPTPTPVQPVVEPSPVPDPDATDPDAVDPDGTDPDATDPDADPDGADPDADPDATTEAELAHPLLAEDDPGKREQAVQALWNDTTASAALVKIARTDESLDVRIKAWQAVSDRYQRGVGDQAVHEALIVDALKTGVFSKREAAIAYGEKGTDIQLLKPLIERGGTLEMKAGANAMVKIAKREGSQEAARPILQAQLEKSSFINKKILQNAIDDL